MLRLALVGVGTFLLLWYTSIHKMAYTGALIVTFIIFQIVEIAFLLKRIKKEKETSAGQPNTE